MSGPGRRATRALAAGALALLLGALGAGPAAATTGGTPTSGSSASSTAGSDAAGSDAAEESALGVATGTGGVALEVLSSSGATLTPESGFAVELRVTGLDAAAQAAATVRIYASSSPLTTEGAVQSWADGRGQVRGDVALVEQPLVAAGATAPTAQFSVPAGSLPSLGRSWGPRGITIEVVDADSQRLASQRTFVVWLPSGDPDDRAGVAVLVPLSAATAPDVGTGEVPVEALAALTADGGRLDRVLRAASGPGVSWALDPAVLGPPAADAAPSDGTGDGAGSGTGAGTGDAASDGTEGGDGADGSEAEPSGPVTSSTGGSAGAADAWVARVTGGADDREVVALPRTEPDVDALAAAGASDLYGLAEDQTRTAVSDLLGAAPDTALAWPAGGVPTAGGWALAAGAGRSALVLDAADTGDTGTTSARVAVETGDGTVPGLVADASASRALTEGAAVGGSPVLTAARLLAESALVALGDGELDDAGAVPMLLTTPRTWNADPEAAEQVLAALGAAPWVSPSTPAQLLAAPAGATVTLTADDDGSDTAAPDPLPVSGVREVAAAEQRALTTSVALADPSALVGVVERSAVAATSTWWRTDTATWREGVSALTATSRAVDDGVRVLRGSSVNVLSSEVALPVTIANDLDQDVTVRVSLRSTTARLQPDQEYQEVVVAAQRQQLVQLPVTAVASGDTVLTVVLSTAEGAGVGVPQMLQVRVRADWEGRGIAVMAVVVVLVLVTGIVRTVRRHRRHPRRATSLGVELAPPPGPGPGGSSPAHSTDDHDHDDHRGSDLGAPHQTRSRGTG